MLGAFGQTEEKITSQMNLQPISERNEFDENLPTETHLSKTE